MSGANGIGKDICVRAESCNLNIHDLSLAAFFYVHS